MIAEGRDTRPLTRHVLAWYPQWRRADPTERDRLRKRCLAVGFAETLERLEQNIQAYRGRVVPDGDGPLEVLLAGLSAPEPERVIHDLARAVYPESGEWQRERAAMESLCRRLERHFPASKQRAKAPAEPGIGAAADRAAAAVKKTAPGWVRSKTVGPGKPQCPDGEANFKNLWAGAQAILAGKNLDPLTCILGSELLLDLSTRLSSTPGSVAQSIYTARKRIRDREGNGALPPAASRREDYGPAAPPLPPEPGEDPDLGPKAEDLESLRAEIERLKRADLRHMEQMHRDEARHMESFAQAQATIREQAAEIERLRESLKRREAEASAPPPDREPEPSAYPLASTEPELPATPERLTEEQRMAAFQLLGNCPGTISERRRVLVLAADLAAVAESR